MSARCPDCTAQEFLFLSVMSWPSSSDSRAAFTIQMHGRVWFFFFSFSSAIFSFFLTGMIGTGHQPRASDCSVLAPWPWFHPRLAQGAHPPVPRHGSGGARVWAVAGCQGGLGEVGSPTRASLHGDLTWQTLGRSCCHGSELSRGCLPCPGWILATQMCPLPYYEPLSHLKPQ